MSNLDIAAVIAEIRPLILESWLNNVYEIDGTFLFKIRTPQGDVKILLFEVGKRFHLTWYKWPVPKFPSGFCMSLRNKLKRSKIIDVYQHDLDRIIVFVLMKSDQKFKLIFELFGDGNLILLDEDDKVIFAYRFKKMRDRVILPKAEFKFPPMRGKNPLEIDSEELAKIFSNSNSDVVRTLVSSLNIAGEYAEEVCSRCKIAKSLDANKLNVETCEEILRTIKELLNKIEQGDFNPIILRNKENLLVTVLPLQFTKYGHEYTVEHFSTFNEALDTYFTALSDVKPTEEKEKKSKYDKIIEAQLKKIEKLNVECEKCKQIGDLIYANFTLIDELLRTIKSARDRGYSWNDIIKTIREGAEKGIKAAAIFKDINKSKGEVIICINGIDIQLDSNKTAGENASVYYEKAKKAESKIVGAKKALKDMIEKKKCSEEEIKEKTVIFKRREKKWYEKFRWFLTSQGFLVVGGKDARTNEILIKKYLETEDIVMHAEIQGAPVVIIKTNGKEPAQDSLYEAAQFAASFSRGWRVGVGQLDVYWVKAGQVSLSPPSGQYLPKGSVIITGERNYIKNVPLELALGVKFENNMPIFMCGPPSAIKNHAEKYIEITTGETPTGKLARELKHKLAEMFKDDKREILKSIPIEEIQNILPPGGGEIKRK